MSNITPTSPSFVFGYWRPWKENSNAFDSYLDYVKDKSLVKYGADTVGKYISQASKEQVTAINHLGQAIGQGMNVLSEQLSDIHKSLLFINRNIDILIEQQKLSNILLKDVAELLGIPESEKERLKCVELGIKFFVNAERDPDLYSDALEEFLKAESLMKQDYFVLHRIGCIYLFSAKHIDPQKALDYFSRASKYASVESNPLSMRLVNSLIKSKLSINQENNENYLVSIKLKSLPKPPRGLDKIDTSNHNETMLIFQEGDRERKIVQALRQLPAFSKQYFTQFDMGTLRYKVPKIIDDSVPSELAETIREQLLDLGADVEIIYPKKSDITNNLSSNDPSYIEYINYVSADSYDKAAFASYVLGQFENAVIFQSKSFHLAPNSQKRFVLAKYQVRNGNITEGLSNLRVAIEENPALTLGVLKELDLANEPMVINLIEQMNVEINNKIDKLIEKWNSVDSDKKEKSLAQLIQLKQGSYDLKVQGYQNYTEDILSVNKKIDDLIENIKAINFISFDNAKVEEIIRELTQTKVLPLEQIKSVFEKFFAEIEEDKLKVGAKYAGGLVFYLDKTGKHGLVCAENDLGSAPWGVMRKIGGEKVWVGAFGNGVADGSGVKNTRAISDYGSFYLEKSLFSNKKITIITAARLCLECNFNGYNDWYLPTHEELSLMIKSLKGLYEFNNAFYWSSTEQFWDVKENEFLNGMYALVKRANYAYSDGSERSRDALNCVRPVRAF